MHRNLTGIAKPAVKRKLEMHDQDTLYKSKHQHGYLKSWEREYVWQSYDDQQSVMFVHCVEHIRRLVFTERTLSLRGLTISDQTPYVPVT